jgi:lysophospholipase L1-like esterase
LEWYEPEVQALERQLLLQPPPARPVTFYGSSSIRLWTSLPGDFPDVPTANLGFGGSTMAACSWFYWRIVRPVAPRALVLYAGDNDIGDGAAPAEVVRQLRFLLEQVDASSPDVPVSLISIKPSPARWSLVARIEEANRGMRAVVEQRKRGVWVDVFQPMLSAGQPRGELFCEDGLHLSDAGYALWQRVLNRHRPAAF